MTIKKRVNKSNQFNQPEQNGRKDNQPCCNPAGLKEANISAEQ